MTPWIYLTDDEFARFAQVLGPLRDRLSPICGTLPELDDFGHLPPKLRFLLRRNHCYTMAQAQLLLASSIHIRNFGPQRRAQLEAALEGRSMPLEAFRKPPAIHFANKWDRCTLSSVPRTTDNATLITCKSCLTKARRRELRSVNP